MKVKIVYLIFFGIFIIAGLGCATYGFVRLGIYNAAERVAATVVSAECDFTRNEIDVSFVYEKDGMQTNGRMCYRGKIKYDDYGRLPYYEGKQIEVRLNRAGETVTFGEAEIAAIVVGILFAATGSIFTYWGVLRKYTMFDIAYDYEQAIVLPEDVTDETQKYEAQADMLSRLPQKSPTRMVEETSVSWKRIRDRFCSYTVWQHLLIVLYFLLVMFAFGLYPLLFGKTVTVGFVISNAIFGFFVACLLGAIGKFFYNLCRRISIKRGRFSQKAQAVVVRCAFEASGEISSGDFSRTHTLFKKFKVVALVNGKRSVGYVKGNIPPEKGTVLKVLIRPNRYGCWVIDKD